MNYATIFSYIFCIMSIQSRIISPHNSKTRDKLVMLTCFLKIVLDSDIQQFGQLSTFVSLNSICKKKTKVKLQVSGLVVYKSSFFNWLEYRKGTYHQSPPDAFHGQKLEEQYAGQLSQIRHPGSPNHPLHSNQNRLLHQGIITVMS